MKCLLLEQSPPTLCKVIGAILEACQCETVGYTDIDQAYDAFTFQRPQVLVLTYVNDETLAFAKRARAFDGGNAVILAVFEEMPEISLEEILGSPIDDMILPPLDDFRLQSRLSLVIRRATLHAERQHVEQALRAADAKAQAVLNTTVDGIITVNERGVIDSFNLAAERIFKYKEEEIIGQNITVLMPEPYREEHDGYIKSYQETGHKKIIGIGREVKGKRKDGEIFPMDLAVSEMNLNGKRAYTGIVRDISERRELEKALLSISEQERRRIGQDLHDGLGQMLTGIGLIAQTLTRSLEAKNIPEAKDLGELVDLIREADQQARALARVLVPLDLESGGFKAALLRLSANIERIYGLKCVIEIAGDIPVLDPQSSSHFYHVIQEAMNNAAKHSEATSLKVTLAGNADQLRARVEDNGIGFSSPWNGRGMGLRIMKHRAAVMGAYLDFRQGSKNGTVITCTLPLSHAGTGATER